MNNCDYKTISQTRVYFGPFGSLLLIYIPGIFIEFVDCGAFHPVYPGVMLTQSDLVGDLPKRTRGEVPILEHFPTVADPLKMEGNCFFDCNQGICYEYLIHVPVFAEIFKQCPDHLHKPAIHIAITYIQDKDLENEILRIICLQYPFYIAPLLAELLTCLVYEKINSHQDRMQSGFVNVVPTTSLKSVYQTKNRLEFAVSSLKGYFVYPGNKLIIKDVKQPTLLPRFTHEKTYEPTSIHTLRSSLRTSTLISSWAKGLLPKSNPSKLKLKKIQKK